MERNTHCNFCKGIIDSSVRDWQSCLIHFIQWQLILHMEIPSRLESWGFLCLINMYSSFCFSLFLFVFFILFLFFYLNFLNWSIADIQHCVSFRCAEKWTSYTYTSIHSSQILSSRGSLQLRHHQPPTQLLGWQTGPHCALLPSQHLGASLWFTTLGTGTAPDRPSPGQCAETEMSAALLKE